MLKTIKDTGEAGLREVMKRPGWDDRGLEVTVRGILDEVRKGGDAAVEELGRKFSGVPTGELQVSGAEIRNASATLPAALKKAIRIAAGNIEKFHRQQRGKEKSIITFPGVTCSRRPVPIERVGLYIPGGNAPLFSTVLMLGIPARIAGCREVILCSPPGSDGKLHPAILFAAGICGIKKVFRTGGAQAIAAMTFGTESIPAVSKIVGPGNRYVTMAKMIAQREGVAIDMPAGPSEVLVIADKTAEPAFVAADLIAQAEHGADSQVVLVSDSEMLIADVNRELEVQLKDLPRKEFAEASIRNGYAILVTDMKKAMRVSDLYAPEHLILACRNSPKLASKVRNAGSVFIGDYSCESLGDYASGTNHTLPTGGYASAYSGVSVDTFVKWITFQEASLKGLKALGPYVITMAEAEGLEGHARSVRVRLSNEKKNR